MFEHTRNKIENQLALQIKLNTQATFEDFFWADNNLILKQHILDIIHHSQSQILYIWAERGAGKSHLLQAICHEYSKHNNNAIYLPLKILTQFDGNLFEDLENQPLVVIDDVDTITNNMQWEEGLFHLFNKIRDNETSSLIITGNLPAHNLKLRLKDLQSRLTSCLSLQLLELNDENKVDCLIVHALKKGLKLSPQVAHYLLNHCTRNMIDLQKILDNLDEASLRAKRKLTIPFLKDVLNL